MLEYLKFIKALDKKKTGPMTYGGKWKSMGNFLGMKLLFMKLLRS